MRTAFVQFNFSGVDLSYDCRYETEPTGEIHGIKAKLTMVGPNQEPPTPEQEWLYVHWGRVWHQFYAALEKADAEQNRAPSRDDAMATDERI